MTTNISRTPITRWTCDHLPPPPEDSGTIEKWVKCPDPRIANPSEYTQKDWDFTIRYLAKKIFDLDDPVTYDYLDHLEAIRLCDRCTDHLPSVQERLTRQKQQPLLTQQDNNELQEICLLYTSPSPRD